MNTEDKDNNTRVSIWSVDEGWLRVYTISLTVAMLVMLALVIWAYFGSPPDWVGHIINISKQMASITAWIVVSIFITTEVSMLSTMIVEKYMKKRFEEGRRVGIAEANQKWDDWHGRKHEAESQNLEFTELPPSHRNSSG